MVVPGYVAGESPLRCHCHKDFVKQVILCSRSVANGEKAVEEEIKQLGVGGYLVKDPNIVVKALDLNSLKSVKTFADDILSSVGHIDFLICNAGIILPATSNKANIL